MDRLQSMRVFVKVAEQGNFARAAIQLDLSNAAVTRYVADLENHLGVRLLHRSTRKLSLTEIGQEYLKRSRQILAEVEDADAVATSVATNPRGMLKLYSHISFGEFQLPRFLPPYAEAFPDVTLDVTLSDRSVDLVEDGFDVGIYNDAQNFSSGMIARQLGVSHVILCASPDYIRRFGLPRTPQDLSRHTCLSYAFENLRDYWTVIGPEGKLEIEVKSKLVANNSDLLSYCGRSGMGIVLRPSYTLGDDLKSGRLVRILPAYYARTFSVTLAYPSRRLLSATVRSFVDFMTQQFPQPNSDPWLEP
ncbi:LysR family transcriptional regulator [Oxalobacteraceae bacterium CAVE-383]|nr:LysR family transcriptional regulator [Oxalobacteraceae bacterium CAVE-383]